MANEQKDSNSVDEDLIYDLFDRKGRNPSGFSSLGQYKTDLIYNDFSLNKKVKDEIGKEMADCQSFKFCVAFINDSGVNILKQELKDAADKNIPGQILTTDYLTFSDPKALRELMAYKNIEVRMFKAENGIGFHTKGYLFKKSGAYEIIIGSSNLTQSALCLNKEWNSKIASTDNAAFCQTVLNEFSHLWGQAVPLSECIDEYEKKYKEAQSQTRITDPDTVEKKILAGSLTPNRMQAEFISNFDDSLKAGNRKGLLVSATGTGKTFAAAFALKNMAPKKFLYICHREQILEKSMQDFQIVLGDKYKMGLLSGNSKPSSDCGGVFSTVEMMAKEDVRENFRPDEFDLIIIDEVQHAGSASYQKIIPYFDPVFMLGMSATPERMDGYDVYKLFDNNILYQIRLNQALENDLLCPFHYFGITDFKRGPEEIADDENLKDFNLLVCDERVKYIIEEAQYYGFCGKKVKGLVFCSSVEESDTLALKFRENGYRALSLCGADKITERDEAIKKLQADPDTTGDYLDYIFTVDIFNEGVDIPKINQILMLRPTQSAVIFVQQLGRGLRKAQGKDFVVVIDFIGNYNNNYLIPTAFTEKGQSDKDTSRVHVARPEIFGASNISFDAIAKAKIYKSIENASYDSLKVLRESYATAKATIGGKIPTLLEFEDYGTISPTVIFNKREVKSYYAFLRRVEPDYKVLLNPNEDRILSFISFELGNGKRIHELLLLKKLIENPESGYKSFVSELLDVYKFQLDSLSYQSIINVLNGSFSKSVFDPHIIEEQDGQIALTLAFQKALQDSKDFKDLICDTINYGIHIYENEYREHHDGTVFTINKRYTYKDVARLLCYARNPNALNIGGYNFDSSSNSFSVFINYQKNSDISATTKYEDHLDDNGLLTAYSKNKRTLNSSDMREIRDAEKNKTKIYLFMRKTNNDKEEKNFFYLGLLHLVGDMEQTTMPNEKGQEVSVVKIHYSLETPIKDDIYDYITLSEK
jgi:superfamily II DNA or RNA helicase/HKD family nuclease